MGILVIGAVYVDIKGYPLGQFLPQGRNAGRIEQVHGGVSRNIAEDIAGTGLHPTFVSLVDRSGAGQDVIDRLNRSGVDTRYIRAAEDGMGTWLAIFDNAGDCYASISKRPDLQPIAALLEEEGDGIFAGASCLLLEIDIDDAIISGAFRLAEKYRLPVYASVSNMTIALERMDYLKKTDCFVCNLQEAGILFGKDFSGAEPRELQAALPVLCEAAGFRRMVVTMGDRGAVWCERGGSCGFCPPKQVTVKDTTGAGDAFFSGVSVGLDRGCSMEEACRLGSELAAACITTTENVAFVPDLLK